MTAERDDLMPGALRGIRSDVGAIGRGQAFHGLCAPEGHVRGPVTTIYGIQTDAGDLQMRVDRIDRRPGLADTEH